MNDERWRRVEAICHDALERPGHERAEFIHAACAGDESMRVEVASLLASQSRADALETVPGIRDVGLGLIGTQLGVYQVVSLLGAGGMGEVYRARDTKLGRDVAIKVLPAAFTADADRGARFERESRVLASLNHPHIGAIYGFEESNGLCFLVLELIEWTDAGRPHSPATPCRWPRRWPLRVRSPRHWTRRTRRASSIGI